MTTDTNQEIDPRLLEIENDNAPEASSFFYKGRLAKEEWVFLTLEQRTRGSYVKEDVPYYHIAFQPLSYTIGDGGPEDDGLEHTYVKMRNSQGELTPKSSTRQAIVNAMTALGYPRNTIHDLSNHSAIGKVFLVKRFNQMYQFKKDEPATRGELMNLPTEELPSDWAPAPGTTVPVVNRKYRERDGSAAPSGGVTSGSIVKPISVSTDTVADALVGTEATESAVRNFIFDHNEYGVGDILDGAMKGELMAKLVAEGKITTTGGIISRA